jgi:regulator of protease activity HflC (stomatin/prohibitin superfamily)
MASPQLNFDTSSLKFPSRKIATLVGLLVLSFILFRSLVTFVPPGHVGVVYDRGRGVLDKPLHEGINIMIPFWQTATLFDTRLQEYTMTAVQDEGAVIGDDALDAPTSDGQTVKVDATVLFRVDPEKAPVVFKTIGEDYTNKLIRPFSRSQIRMVISRYSAPSIYSEKRQEAEEVMTNEIRELLKDKNIIIDKVLLRSVNFSPEYSAAIEAKVIAEQRVKQAEYEVLEASQRAQAKVQEAKGLAEAQALQRQTLNQEFLQFEAIKKWDGRLPQAMGTGSTVPFINIPQ